MNTLAIDTSTRTLSLALAIDGTCVSYRNIVLNRRMADAIVPHITAFLRRRGLGLEDIGAVVAGRGPGSFTSLRVGVATVKGLCFGRDIPVVGIPSPAAVAAAVAATPGKTDCKLCVISDARRGLLYAATYRIEEERPVAAGDCQLLPWKELRRQLTKPVVFAGDGVTLHREDIVKAFGPDAALTDPKFLTPQARYLLPAGLAAIKDGRAGDAATLEPLYLYAEDCQVRP